MNNLLTIKLAERLLLLRKSKDLSLEQLSVESGISRSTLSRLEKAEVSPTTEILGKLCAVYGLSLTRMLSAVEDSFEKVIRVKNQSLWEDKTTGFNRRSISPPSNSLAAEVVECQLRADTHLSYDSPSIAGQEHHLIMLDGYLELTIEAEKHCLNAGDSLRYKLFGASKFETTKRSPAKYLLVLI
ncbi:XRE family transcriptional regulator [Alphaproteobacteria bacterium 46_93_T64]|nr:XRE family transcriptional regulator [Alphaproteobacteria bacterium 46_93_T64]